MFKQKIALSLFAMVAIPGLHAQEPAKTAVGRKEPSARPASSSKTDLTADSFAMLHALIRPHDQEWRHLQVHWLTDVVAVRQRAAAEDKPIVICYTGGAGYNEPLGVC
jgi:hypothetical protein